MQNKELGSYRPGSFNSYFLPFLWVTTPNSAFVASGCSDLYLISAMHSGQSTVMSRLKIVFPIGLPQAVILAKRAPKWIYFSSAVRHPNIGEKSGRFLISTVSFSTISHFPFLTLGKLILPAQIRFPAFFCAFFCAIWETLRPLQPVSCNRASCRV